MSEARNLRDLMRIRSHNRDKIDAVNSNLGTALSFKKPTNKEITDILAIIVFVPQKVNPKWFP